jgi:integrase
VGAAGLMADVMRSIFAAARAAAHFVEAPCDPGKATNLNDFVNELFSMLVIEPISGPRNCAQSGYLRDSRKPKGRNTVENPHLRLVAPTTVLRTVPKRKSNIELRPREYLTEDEIERLRKAAGENRNDFRAGERVHGGSAILAAVAMDLPVIEVDLIPAKGADLRRPEAMPEGHQDHRRVVELRALRRVKREAPPSAFVFVSERGAPFTVGGFRRMVGRLGVKAGFTFQVHPHQLRHACGYKLANDGHNTRSLQHYLGHKNIQHTVRYTELAPDRFKGFWRD